MLSVDDAEFAFLSRNLRDFTHNHIDLFLKVGLADFERGVKSGQTFLNRKTQILKFVRRILHNCVRFGSRFQIAFAFDEQVIVFGNQRGCGLVVWYNVTRHKTGIVFFQKRHHIGHNAQLRFGFNQRFLKIDRILQKHPRIRTDIGKPVRAFKTGCIALHRSELGLDDFETFGDKRLCSHRNDAFVVNCIAVVIRDYRIEQVFGSLGNRVRHGQFHYTRRFTDRSHADP